MSKVSLIATITPLIAGVERAEDFVAYCARVSNPSNQFNHETAPRLLKYLTTNGHWSPFEMASAVMEIETTRDIGRQILRHRSFSFQEFSQRYAEVPDAAVYREARMQDTANRQNSTPLLGSQDGLAEAWLKSQQVAYEFARDVYEGALAQGIAKEVARAVLPEGLTPSRMYMAGTIRSWIHYIQLRSGNGTQKEHREIALMCKDALLAEMPTLEEVLNVTHDH